MNTENEQPNYYSILTANVRYDKNLKANEKLLFSEITALSNKYGYCTASNRYFAELYQVTDRVIRKWISDLAQLGYLKIILVSKDGKIIGRKMYPSNNFREEQMFQGGTNVPRVRNKCSAEGGTNVPLNITSINTINNNNILTDNIPYGRVIKYLNAKAGTNYRATNKATQRLIKARFNEGMTTKDFKKVIDNKCDDWLKDPKMRGYLRPATLFGSKFESYLNQKPKRLDQSATNWHEYSTRADTDNSVSSDNDEPTLSAEELDKIFNSFGKSENT
ncbi:conserved phage C-terminal domain-containing protein [Lactobacillus iners]|uniref:conserved phage C-terminal domain-containing protein n=1 Tax=Lactobacillus iners TaxID=147802 RepID=UPI001F09752E|nr:conserved phage C-terminal domain-containing protein [Lactobacillus iners]